MKKQENTTTSNYFETLVSITRPLILAPVFVLLSSCGGGGDNAPEAFASSSAARTSLLQTNDSDCPDGGILVETGIDENGNGVLDNSEVDSKEKVCNGSAGVNGTDP